MTTPLPSPPPHDDDALPGEAELKALYGRLPQRQPGPVLDAAVLRAAAQAVQCPAPRRHARWPVALGSAATLVLTAGLVWQLRRRPADAPVTSPVPGPTASADAQAGAGRAAIGAADAALQQVRGANAQAMRRESAHPSAPAVKAIGARPVIAPPATADYLAPTASAAMGIGSPKPTASRISTSHVPVAKSAEPAPAPAPITNATMAHPTSPMAPTPMATPHPDASSTMQRLRAVEPSEQATPAMTAELQAIRARYDQGHGTAARARLEAFHRRHPRFVLPDGLRQRLDGAP